MPLNSSGAISLGGSTTGQSINLELSQSATAQVSLNDTNVRTLAGVSSGQISLSSFYGKSTVVPNQILYDSPGPYTFTVPAGVTSVSMCTIGGGGASGYSAYFNLGFGGGGGAGGDFVTYPCDNGTLKSPGGGGGGVGIIGIGSNGVGGGSVGSQGSGGSLLNYPPTGPQGGYPLPADVIAPTYIGNAEAGYYGGGGGSISNDAFTTCSPVEICDEFGENCYWDYQYLPLSVSSGGRGAVRIMWGGGRSYPNNALTV